MTAEPRNLDEAWMEARAAVLEIRAAQSVAYTALSLSLTPIEELSHADDILDLNGRERLILDALRVAAVMHDL